MAFRFRKSINLGGGARVNFSKSGIGASVGGKGCRVTKKADGGTRATVGIPGTGLSYQKDSKKSQAKSSVSAAPAKPAFTFFWIMFTILSFPLIALGALLMLAEPVIGAAFVAFGVILLISARHYKKKIQKKVGQRETTDT